MKRILSAALALTLLGGTVAQAAPIMHSAPVTKGVVEVQYRGGYGDHNGYRGGYGDHYGYRGDFRGPRFHAPARWHRGGFYRSRFHGGYVVSDWRYYHLRRPPYGYHWVNVNGDLLLVAITTGLIVDLLAHSGGYSGSYGYGSGYRY